MSKVHVYRHGAEATLYGEDAINACHHVLNSTQDLQQFEDTQKLTLPTQQIDQIVLQLLQTQHYSHVQRWVKDASDQWIREKQTAHVTAIAISIIKHQIIIGIAKLQKTENLLQVTQFVDDYKFSELRTALKDNHASQILIQCLKDSPHTDHLNTIIEKTDAEIQVCPNSAFKIDRLDEDLDILLAPSEAAAKLFDLTIARGALACLIGQEKLTSLDENNGKFRLRHFSLSHHMSLDSAAIRSLDLFSNESDYARNTNLFDLLNVCRTVMGSRLLRKWIHYPLFSPELIKKRLKFVSIFFNETSLRQSLHDDHLRGIPDLCVHISKVYRESVTLKDCVIFYNFATGLMSLVNTLQEYDGPEFDLFEKTFIIPLADIVSNLRKYEEFIEKAVDLNALEATHEYLVRPEFDESLGELHKDKEELLSTVEDERKDIADELSLDLKHVKINHSPQHGTHLKVTRKLEKKLRGGSQYIFLQTNKDGVKFSTRSLSKISDRLEEVRENYNEIQECIVEKIVSVYTSYLPVMLQCLDIIPILDVFVSLATVSAEANIPYVKPEILPASEHIIEMHAARHPCLEAQDFISFIPNNVSANAASRFQIITGPNMGGKSTYIRTIGMVCLMAQIGCFVPCDYLKLSVVDCILMRVGAGDNQLKGVSTFMSEMLETSSIVHYATENSLVIIDELGRGTSTSDGFGIAWALSDYIVRHLKCFTFFTTHFHELTTLEKTHSCVSNKHVSATTSNDSLVMLYEIMDGPADQSFGVEVAKMVRFPDTVVNLASKKVDELESSVDFSRKRSRMMLEDEGSNLAFIKRFCTKAEKMSG